MREVAGLPMKTMGLLAVRIGKPQATVVALVATLMALAAGSWTLGRPAEDLLVVDFDAIDPPALRFVGAHREPWLTGVVQEVTRLGGYRLLLALVLVAGLAWWVRRRTWRPLLLLAGAYGGAVLLTYLVKATVGRARPPRAEALSDFGGKAFPSGHALQATAVWGMLAVLLAASATGRRTKVLTWAGGATVAVMVGASRVYLGAHWPTDVMAGWLIGTLWLAALVLALHPAESVAPHRS